MYYHINPSLIGVEQNPKGWFSFLKSIVARAGRRLGLYVCAAQVCVCLCAVGGPFGSYRKQICGLGETVSGQCFLYSFVDAVDSPLVPAILCFFPSVLINVMAASIIITRRVSHSSLSFPQCEWGSGFSILPAVPALFSSIPPFLPQPRQAHPAQEIHGDNG